MLWTIVVVLLVLWALGLVTSYTMGRKGGELSANKIGAVGRIGVNL